MYNIIPLVLILTSLAVIIVVTVRKFPALANLDVANIPAEKEAKFKEKIISNRLKRNFFKWQSKINRIFRPSGHAIANFFKWFYQKLIDWKNSYKIERPVEQDDLEKRIVRLFDEAEEMKRLDNSAGAEKNYIEIIGLDSKNIKAFRFLAQLYFNKKDFEEARQTYEHILKLNESDVDAYDALAMIAKEGGDLELAKSEYLQSININSQRSQTYYELALVCEAMKELDESIVNLKKALEIEPANPRYLDTAIRISIIMKDKNAAAEFYEALKKVNPENQKLVEFREQIDLL